jgi:hypothetical protein
MGSGIDSYKPQYMHYPLGGFQDTTSIKLEYDGDKIIKRIGGTLQLSSSSPYSYIFSKEVYDEISYSSDEAVMITKFDSPDINTSDWKEKFRFSHGKIVECIILKNYSDNNDTIKYYYKNRVLVKRVSYGRKGLNYQSQYYYNNHRNIDSIITRYAARNPVTRNWEINMTGNKRVKEIFLDFDNYANPVKNLMIFDEIFNRSLSENNYSRYEKYEYDENGTIIAREKRWWKFIYENGRINFDKL